MRELKEVRIASDVTKTNSLMHDTASACSSKYKKANKRNAIAREIYRSRDERESFARNAKQRAFPACPAIVRARARRYKLIPRVENTFLTRVLETHAVMLFDGARHRIPPTRTQKRDTREETARGKNIFIPTSHRVRARARLSLFLSPRRRREIKWNLYPPKWISTHVKPRRRLFTGPGISVCR